MGLFSWRQWFSRKVRAARRSTPARDNYVRPRVEQLETRLAPATLDIWTGADATTNNNWSDPKNWTTTNPGGIPVAGDDLRFQSGVTGKGLTSHNDLASLTVFNSIELKGSGYTLTGNSITINNTTGGNSLIDDAFTTNTISLGIQLGGNSGGNAAIDVQSSGTLTISGQLTTAPNATAQLNLTDKGTLVLSADNSAFNGNIAVEEGVLQITTPTALGNPTGNFDTTVSSQGQLQLNNVNGTVRENLDLSGGYIDTSGALLNVAGTTTWSSLSTITLDANATIGAATGTPAMPSTLTVAGLITDNNEGHSLTKEGGGQVILSHANTYRGQTLVNNGLLTIQNNQALGDPNAAGGGTLTSDTVVNSNASESGTLQIDGSNGAINVQNEILVLNGRGYGYNSNTNLGGIGALDNLVGNNTWNGNVILGSQPADGKKPSIAGGTIDIASEASTAGTTTTISNLTITGNIADWNYPNSLPAGASPYNLVKIGPGRITLEPLAGGNTYLGTTTVQNGFLRIEDSQAMGPTSKTSNSAATSVLIGAALELYADPNHIDSVTGAATMHNGVLKGALQVSQYLNLFGLGISEQGALHSIQGINTWTNTISLGGGYAYDFRGFFNAVGSIGVDADPNPSATNAYLKDDDSLTVTGSIINLNLAKVGAGQLILPNANNYQNTDIQQGWITAENSNSLGQLNMAVGLTQQYTVSVEYGAALHLLATGDGSLNLVQNFIVSGNGISHPFKGDTVNTFGINQAGAIENLEGTNTLSGFINLENNAGIGAEQIFTTAGQNQSQLTLTGPLQDYVPPTRSFTQSGTGPDEQDFSYNTGAISGSLTVNYNFFGATPDDLQVRYSGTILNEVTGSNTVSSFTIPYGPGPGNVPPPSTTIQVIVNPGGAATTASWNFTVTFAPTLVGGGLDKLGSQELVLQGPGTYTGSVHVKEGVLLDQNSTALGASGFGGVTVASGAALLLGNSTALENGGLVSGLQILNKSLTLQGGGNSYFLTTGVTNPLDPTTVYSDGNPATTSSGGSPPSRIAPLTSLVGDNYWSGPVTLGTSSVIDVEPNARLSLAGAFDDGSSLATPPPASDLTKIGIGELVLTGASAYRGTTWINQGIVTVGNSQALGAIPPLGATQIAGAPAGAVLGGTVVAAGASLQMEGNVSVAGEPLAIQGTGPTNTPVVGETWFPLGPAGINADAQDPGNQPVSGRVTAVVTDPTDPNTIYVGTAGGGVWRTLDGGKSWHPLFDALNLTTSPPNVPMFIGAIAIDPNHPQTIYVGTGEADAGDTIQANDGGPPTLEGVVNPTYSDQGTGVLQVDSYPGTGVYESTNSGVTWTLLTNPDGSNTVAGDDVTSIVVDPNPYTRPTIYVATSNVGVLDPNAPQGAVYRYDATDGYVNLIATPDSIRTGVKGVHLNPPGTPGPDDDYRIRFPGAGDGAQEWSSLAIGREILYDAFGNETYPYFHPNPNPFPNSSPYVGEVLYASLGTPEGNPGDPTNPDGNFTFPNVVIPPEGLIFNAVYHTDDFNPNAAEFAPPLPFSLRPTPSDSPDSDASLSDPPNWLIGSDTPPSSGVQTYDQENSNEFPTDDGAGSQAHIVANGLIKIAYASSAGIAGAGNQGTIYATVAQGLYFSDGMPVPALNSAAYGSLYQFEQSVDGGKTWTPVPLPTNYLGDATTNPSINTPNVFPQAINPPVNPPRSPFADAIAVTPSGSQLYVGGSTPTNSVQEYTGSWSSIATGLNGNGPFNDFHAMTIDSQGRLVVGTDGGIFRFDPTTGNWTDLNGNLDISLTTSVAVAPTALNVAVASSHETGVAIDSGNQAWTYATLGDGQVRIDPINPNIYYAVDNTTGLGTLLESTQSGAPGTWNPVPVIPSYPGPFIQDLAPLLPNDPTRLLVATNFIPRPGVFPPISGVYEDDNGTWNNLGGGGVLLVAPADYQGTYQADASFNDAPNIGSDGYAKGTIYALNKKGQIEVTEDHGGQWLVRTIPGLLGSITGLAVDPRTSSDAFAVTDAGNVYMTTNFGQEWTDISGDLGSLANHSIVIDPRTSFVYVGTEEGVYLATGEDGASTSWTRFGIGMPTARVSDLVLNETTDTLTASTYGRGVFQLTLQDATADDGALRAVSGTSIWAGPITLDGNTTFGTDGTQVIQDGFSAASLEISGAINDLNTSGSSQGYNLTKIGDGTLKLAGANTYTGNTDDTSGVVIVLNSQALGTSAGLGTIVEGGAVLQMQSNISGAHLYLNGNGILVNDHNTGALWDSSGQYTYSGPITLQTDSTIGVDSGAILTIANADPAQTSIDDGSGNQLNLIKEGNGILVFSGTNTYHGNTNVNQGILQITNGSALGGTPGTTATFVTDGAQLELEAPTDSTPFTVTGEKLVLGGTGIFGSGALLDDRGSDTWAGPITLTSLANPTGFPATLPTPGVSIGVPNAADTLTISGAIDQKTANGIINFGINKVGLGELVLQSKDTFTGNNTIFGGTLTLEDSQALGLSSKPAQSVTVNAGTMLQLKANPSGTDSITGTGNLDVTKALILNGKGVDPADLGVLYNASGNNTWAGAVTLQSNSTIGTAASTTLTISGRVNDNNSGGTSQGYTLTKIGTGTLVLSGANTYTGQTLVMAGILEIANATALGGTGNGGTTVSAGASLQLEGGITVSNATLTLQGNGFNSSTGALDAIGADTWNNTITLTGNSTLGAENNATLTVKGIISGGFGITKIGAGEVDLTAAETYTELTEVDAGLLLVDGSIANGAVLDGGTLGGIGTINGSIGATGVTGSMLAPGDGSSAGGILTVKGNVTLNSAVTYYAYLVNGNSLGTTPPGYSQLNASGTVTLNNANLTGSVTAGYNPGIGTQFTPIQATNPVVGTFNVFNSGANVVFSNFPFDVAYNPTSNPNDPDSVVLTRDVAATSTTLTASPSTGTSVYGQPVTFTATVAPEPNFTENAPPDNSGPPSGIVDFYLDGTLVLAHSATPDSITNGDSNYQFTYFSSSLIPAPHTIYAVYQGDGGANYLPSTSATLDQTVTSATPVVTVTQTNPASTTIPVTGQPFTVTAQVSPPYTDPNNTFAGTVNFYLGTSTTPLNSNPITVSSGQASYTFTNGLPAAGSAYTITAKFTYSGSDSDFTNAQGQLTETIVKDPTVMTLATTATTADYGTPKITATVTHDAKGGGTPTGTVKFTASPTSGSAITDIESLVNGVATMARLLPVGNWTITATYNGDSNYITSTTDGANGDSGSVSQTINKATTTVTVTGPATTPVYGQSTTFTATVKPEGAAGTLAGSVTFVIDSGSPIPAATMVQNADGSYTATYTTDTLTATNGTPHTVQAFFTDAPSDGNFNNGQSTVLNQTINQAAPTVGVQVDNNPAVTGQKVTITATVSPPFAGTPTGTAEFIVKDQGGTTVVDDKNIGLNGSGVATDSTSLLAASGTAYSITVNYSGDSNFQNSSGSLSGGEAVNKASTTASVASASPNPTTYGTSVTFTATVTVNAPGSAAPGEPSGKVDFYSDGNFLGQGTLNGASTDQATWTTSPGTQLSGGIDKITAKYEGDSNYNASPTSASTNETVNTAPTTTGAVTYTSSPDNPPGVGDTITFSVTVTSNLSGIGAPTGTVNFLDGTKVIGTGTVASTSGSSATFQGNVSTLAAGSHSITAQYVSDGNFGGSSGSPALSLTVTKAQTTTALSPSSSGTEAYGQQLVSVKVTPNTSNAVVPTGQVTFTVKVGSTTFTTETDTLDNNGMATLKALLPVGQTYSITASYAGDNNFNNSATSSALSEAVTAANSTTVVTGPVITPVTGQPITFAITVSPQYNGVPQGTVNLYLGSTSGTQLNTSPIALNASGKATFTYQPGLTADHSSYNIIATFTDSDGNFNNSDNTANPLSQAVNKDNTATSVSSGQQTSTYGDTVTFTATVSASSPGSGTPGGLVDFFVNGNMVGQGTLNGLSTDQAVYTTKANQLPGGSDQVTAKYEGDNNFLTSTSTAITQTVNAAATTTGSVSASWAGSTNTPPTPPVSGQQITLSATVSGGTATLGSPTGTVDFFDGNTLIGQGTLSDNGDGTSTATTTVTDLLQGTHSLTAKYLTDGNFATSKSASATSLIVDQVQTTTKVQTSSGSATYGQTPVTATVTANSPGSGTPTGTVTFTATGGGNTYTDTENLSSGTATMTQLLPVLPAGQSYAITAHYNGDSNYSASPESSSITQSYSTANDTVTVVSNTDPSISGQSVTFTAIITPQYTGVANGTVLFEIDGGVPSDESASGVAVSGGQAMYTTSALGVGTHTVTAFYTSSDANFANNHGTLAGGQTVNAATPPPPPPPPPPSGGGGGGGSSSSQPAQPAFNFNLEFSLLETDAIYFAFYNQLAALGGYADLTLDAYVNYFLEQIYSNPLTFTASGSYAISLGYDIGIYYFDLTQPQPTA